MAITDLADASYFFALGAKVQARKPGRPGPFDLVDPRAQRGRRGPIQVPRCVKSIRLFFLGRPNYFFCRRFPPFWLAICLYPPRTNSLKLKWARIRSITPPLILALLHLEASRNEVSLKPWLGYGCRNLGVRIERRAESHISNWSARVNHVREWKPINLQIWEEDCHQTKHDLRCGPIWIWHLWSNAHTGSPILERPELVTF